MNQFITRGYNLVVIRWISFLVLIVTFIGSQFFGSQELAPSLIILAFHFLSNLLFHFRYRQIVSKYSSLTLCTLICLDSLFLTFLISQNGGSHNPFSSLYLVFSGLAAFLLPLPYLIAAMAVIQLFLASIYSALPFHLFGQSELNHFNLHLLGMWLANSLGILLVCAWIYLLRRLNDKIALRYEATQKILTNLEKTESLGRIVAQASHQLNTPLGTLQLGLSELADPKLSPEDKKKWLQDMQHAIYSMSQIISQIHQKPLDIENNNQKINLEQFISSWVLHWAQPRKINIPVTILFSDRMIISPIAEKLGNILTIILDNAFEATGKQGPIELKAQVIKNRIVIDIIDKGIGMTAKTLEQACEPLFTTKPSGTGLGLYLARQLVQQMNGQLIFKSKPDDGTKVTIEFDERK